MQSPNWSYQKMASWLVLTLLGGALIWLTLDHPWLFQRLTPMPLLYTLFFGAALVAALGSSRFAAELVKIYLRTLYAVKSLFIRHKWIMLCGSLIGLTMVFWYFRIQRVDSGDILHFRYAAVQGQVFFVEHAPLETVLRCWVAIIHHTWPWIPLPLIFKIQICVYGAVYVLAVCWLASRLQSPYSVVLPLLLVLSPALGLFCGYLEVYAFPLLMQVVFLLMAMLFLHGRLSLPWVSAGFGLAIAAGFWNGILGLGYLYLLWQAWRRNALRITQLPEHLLYLIAPIFISLALLSPYTNPFAGFITRLSEPSLLIPLNPEAQAKNYHLFSSRHLADWANETLLAAALPFMLFFSRLLSQGSFIWRMAARPELPFALLMAFPAYIFGFLYYPVIGFPLDWDLYTFIFPSAACLGAVMMKDIFYSRIWRKRAVVVTIGLAVIASAWVLQNALFWRYPFMATKIGPVVSRLVPDFYYHRMQQAFKQNFETHLYWLAEKAVEESPSRYQEIMTFMDDWTIATLGKIPPKPFDHPGWARDMAYQPGTNRLHVFDRYGRIFRYENDRQLRWIYAPDELLGEPVVAGDFTNEGHAVMLTKRGQILRVQKSVLDEYKENVLWRTPERLRTFLPKAPGERAMPLHLIDLAVKGNENAVCVVDNYNRVWNTKSENLILQGEPSYNLVKALHFVNNQPVTIDVNNRLSYDPNHIQFPFETSWFYPIIRDFYITNDQKGILMLDLNGKVHYTGSAMIYEEVVTAGQIVDRYIRFTKSPNQDRLLLLDNRYRIVRAEADAGGVDTRNKIEEKIENADYVTTYHTLQKLWKRGSHYTPICYELLDTKFLRAIAGLEFHKPEQSIDMVVDVLPLREDFIILVDRWGRLLYENKGVLFLLEGSGLAHWPRSEAIDGALAENRVMILTQDGQVWEYHHPQIFGQSNQVFDRTPKRWLALADFADDQTWVGIEANDAGDTIYATAASGMLLEIPLNDLNAFTQHQLPAQKPIFDTDYQVAPQGYRLAYTSREGPPHIFNSWTGESQAIPAFDFGWEVISDITFSKDETIMLLDRYGVIHQYPTIYKFNDKPYTVAMDAAAIRVFPEKNKALWVRRNGEIRRLRMK